MSLLAFFLVSVVLFFLIALLVKVGYHLIQRTQKEVNLIREADDYHYERIKSLKNLVIFLFKDTHSFLFKRKEGADALAELADIRSSDGADKTEKIPLKNRHNQPQSQSVTENHNLLVPTTSHQPTIMTVQEILKKNPEYAIAQSEYSIEYLRWQTACLRDNTELRNWHATDKRKKVLSNLSILTQIEFSLIDERLNFLNGRGITPEPINGKTHRRGKVSLLKVVTKKVHEHEVV